jgi:hypothetical protein
MISRKALLVIALAPLATACAVSTQDDGTKSTSQTMISNPPGPPPPPPSCPAGQDPTPDASEWVPADGSIETGAAHVGVNRVGSWLGYYDYVAVDVVQGVVVARVLVDPVNIDAFHNINPYNWTSPDGRPPPTDPPPGAPGQYKGGGSPPPSCIDDSIVERVIAGYNWPKAPPPPPPPPPVIRPPHNIY